MNTRKIILIAMLVSLGAILSIIDKYISLLIFPTIPGVKIGLANIIILIGIAIYSFKETFIMALLKSIIVGLILGSVTTFIIGCSATILSFLCMYFIFKILKDKVTLIGVSVIGGFVHTLVQLLMIMILYKMTSDVFLYGLYIFVISLISSIIVGYLGIISRDLLNKNMREKAD